MKNNIEAIKREILNSENLDGLSKLDALTLLDTAYCGIKIKEGIEIIRVLENLYQEVTGDDYKEALLAVINKYRTEIRTLSYGQPQETVTVQDFLTSLKIPTTDIPQETLDLKMVIGIDDGMGYTPTGFMDVIDSYPDEENGEFRIWV